MNENLAKYIDHTLLNPLATEAQIKTLCEEASTYHFASVCINPSYVNFACKLLANSGVKVCTVVGFPLGATSTASKVKETKQAILDGATEIDMVIHQGFVKDKQWDKVEEDIRQVKQACGNLILKVILETCNLTDEEIKTASFTAEKAGADFVKTSTGFASGGATENAVLRMKEAISEKVQIKASGGVRDASTAKHYISLGVSRIGTSSGIAMVKNETSSSSY